MSIETWFEEAFREADFESIPASLGLEEDASAILDDPALEAKLKKEIDARFTLFWSAFSRRVTANRGPGVFNEMALPLHREMAEMKSRLLSEIRALARARRDRRLASPDLESADADFNAALTDIFGTVGR